MRFSGNLRKVLITISLALLIAFLSVLKLPQVALSRVQYSGDWEQKTFDWSMYNYDPHGTRYNTNERLLAANNVGNLKMQWTFTTPTPVTATPSVFEDRVYFGDLSGEFYAVDANTGKQVWKTQVTASVSASALVTPRRVIFGDLAGFIYGLERQTGAVVWKIRPNNYPQAAIWGSGTTIGRYVALGVASNEETAAADPNYDCCSSRGSVVLLDPEDGSLVWQTYTVSESEAAGGSSGASIWSTPTYDEALNLIYVTTGNNFSTPTTDTSDAIIALDARTGKVVWKNQRVADDSWTYRYGNPSPEHPDFDFGDSPQVYRLSNGHYVVGAGNKSGFYFVLDAATGKLLKQNQFEVGGPFGGLFADTAVARGVVYANTINWPNPPTLPGDGSLVAFTGDATKELWRFNTPGSPNQSGVAVANGVVYFQSLVNGNLYALDAKTGTQLGVFQTGVSASGPAVSRGHVYVGTGDPTYIQNTSSNKPGSVVAFGLP